MDTGFGPGCFANSGPTPSRSAPAPRFVRSSAPPRPALLETVLEQPFCAWPESVAETMLERERRGSGSWMRSDANSHTSLRRSASRIVRCDLAAGRIQRTRAPVGRVLELAKSTKSLRGFVVGL